jgi:2-polyprenyl-3-methyl-5-hydroxy-6-metoxy-1,4-benzoquinol methylase
MSKHEVSNHYLGSTGDRYAAEHLGDASSLGYTLNLQWFLPHLRPTDRVLDFGCGNGGMLRLLKDRVAVAEGLEVNAPARGAAEQAGCRIWPSLDALPADAMFDAIVSNHVFEHVRDVCGTLSALREHMRPGGLLITKLPIDDVHARHQRGWSRHDSDHHLQTWTPRLFANVLYESGYDVRECRVLTWAWHPRLFPLAKLGLSKPAFWAFAVFKRRRQLFAVGVNPGAS